ncbi:sulfurtransferase [Diaphorobacter sp. HDW4B]|uniref:rhodanese-like domain-containing protein n=1 Tax=Diaphorobacter sp. HDW4B TaxID=2714925 RepID=UPI0014076415|nr:rhodanese-like domain-containing protein [Diaphorobacter sp. HDW4B]QIL72213.1 sulfurtransferase [Diaphorobacter sp. HDW4B]
MTTTHLSIDFSGADIASRRANAVASFIAVARRLVPDPENAQKAALQSVARALEALAAQTDLFPIEQFPVSAETPAAVFRLSEDVDGRYALYATVGLPGKAQPPHDHTTWAIIAGSSGVERNVFFRREKTKDPERDILTSTSTVDVGLGNSVLLGPEDVHTIELIGEATGIHLHFYGRGLDRLPERVVFENTAGGKFRTFAPPKLIRHATVSAEQLKQAIAAGDEIAVLDVREAGVFARRHILFAAPTPLWRLEVQIDRLVPRRNTRIVLVDADESLVHAAAHKLIRLGYTNVSVLAGGTNGWEAAGFEIFRGTNVPTKAFGEVIEHEKDTPWITSEELDERVKKGDNIVVVDSRTTEEFTAFTLPFSYSLPGAELVYRIGEIAPDPQTLVVVNCAGRTRSIVGAQTLIDAGIPNRVVSLRNGTMDWLLTGRELAYGRKPQLPEPSAEQAAIARVRAAQVAQRAGVRRIDEAELARFQDEDKERTLYLFDVRTRAEYQVGHLDGWRWASGGQLVQATDEYAATRGARIVLADWDGVRALTTAAWLAQLGGWEVYVYAPPQRAPRVTGAEPVRVLSLHAVRHQVSPAQANALLSAGAATHVFDVDSRTAYVRQHVAGAAFVAPDRLREFVEPLPEQQTVILLTSPDGVLAQTVAEELRAQTGRDVRSIAGGTAAWVAAGLPVGNAADAQVLTEDDDQAYSPYAFSDLTKRDAGFVDYLDWELGLVGQLQKEGHTGIGLIS